MRSINESDVQRVLELGCVTDKMGRGVFPGNVGGGGGASNDETSNKKKKQGS